MKLIMGRKVATAEATLKDAEHLANLDVNFLDLDITYRENERALYSECFQYWRERIRNRPETVYIARKGGMSAGYLALSNALMKITQPDLRVNFLVSPLSSGDNVLEALLEAAGVTLQPSTPNVLSEARSVVSV